LPARPRCGARVVGSINLVEHLYAKIDVSNRARAALFAMQHGLMTKTGLHSRPARP